jgi:hypothetical protein
LLNHILIIFNCWGDAALPMFFHKVEYHYWSYLKSFLVYLDRIPEFPRSVIHDIDADQNLTNELNGL